MQISIAEIGLWFRQDFNNEAMQYSLDLHHVTKLKLAHGIYACGHVGAQLQVPQQNFQLK